MTIVQPTLQKLAPPSLETVLEAHKRDIQKSINCARVGIIQSFNAATQTATVQIAQQQVTSISPAGVKTIQEYPLLLQVPVLFPNGGGLTLTFPVAEGDECLVVFNDREIDNWLADGGNTTPTTGRVHDLSDGIAIVGLRSNPRALSNFSTTSAQIRTDDGHTYIDIAPGRIQIVADEVVTHGRNKAVLDAGGTGFSYTPALISTFTDGVATSHSAPTPPAVPT